MVVVVVERDWGIFWGRRKPGVEDQGMAPRVRTPNQTVNVVHV